METKTVIVKEEDEGKRLDKFLVENLPELSRVRIKTLMETGNLLNIEENKTKNKPSEKVKDGQSYVITIPPPVDADPVPQEMDLDIVYEDKDLLVVNKPAGMVVHPAAGNWDGTLVNGLLAHCGDQLSGIGGVKRPGIVHRLDKDTSGLMVVAKSDMAHKSLTVQLSTRVLTRCYLAFVWGHVTPSDGVIETQIGRSKANRKKMAVYYEGGKDAITHYTVLEHFGLMATLIECRLKTGRTHQIRVHMAHKKHWLIGDPTYGRQTQYRVLKVDKTLQKSAHEAIVSFPRQALFAHRMGFTHPRTGEEMTFSAPMPQDMDSLAIALQGEVNKGSK